MQGTNLYIRSNQGFSVLLKDTSTLTLGEPTGFEPATLRLPSGHSTAERLPPRVATYVCVSVRPTLANHSDGQDFTPKFDPNHHT